MNALVSKAIEINEIGAAEDINKLLPRQRDALFSKAFIPFCMSIFAAANPALLDDMHIGEMSYTTFYDYMKGRQRNKRKRNAMEQTAEDNWLIIDWHMSMLVSYVREGVCETLNSPLHVYI